MERRREGEGEGGREGEGEQKERVGGRVGGGREKKESTAVAHKLRHTIFHEKGQFH